MFTSIRLRFNLFFIGLAVAPILLVGGVVAIRSYTVERQQALTLQQETALRFAAQTSDHMSQMESLLKAADKVEGLIYLDSESQKATLSKLLAFQNGFAELTLLDQAGREVIRVNRIRFVGQRQLRDRSNSPEYLQPIATRQTYYSSLIYPTSAPEPLIRIAVPLIDVRSDAIYGVLVGDARIQKVWELLRQDRFEAGEQVYMLTAGGRVIAHQQPSVVLRGTHFDRPAENGIHSGLSSEQVVLSSVPLHFGRYTYYVVAERRATDALALAFQTVVLTSGTTILALLAALTLGVVSVQKVVVPIEQLAKAARAIENGDLSVRVPSHSGDEIGLLSGAFNRMAARLSQTLTGLEQKIGALEKAEREIKELNADLEKRVVERTAELQAANERLKELDRLKSKFIADMTHELRTPLAILNTRIYLMERAGPEKYAHYLSVFQEHVDMITRFVDSVFDLSQLDLTDRKIEFQPVDLKVLVEQVVSVMRPRAEAAGLALNLRLPLPSTIVLGEPNHLSRVITNLVSNAILYTPSGHIEVRLRVEAVDEIVYLEVQDTGIGISFEDQEHIFQRFYRGSNAGQSTIHGMGLGLSVVQEIVTLHKGEIHVDSQMGNGSTFVVQLPLHVTAKIERAPALVDPAAI
jgi:signal transduction histidine kinase